MPKLPSNIEPTKAVEWSDSLARDDARAVLELMDIKHHPNPMGSTRARGLVAEVLLTQPLPRSSLRAIGQVEKRLLLDPRCIVDVEQLSSSYHQPVDWGAIFDWYKQSYPNQIEAELAGPFQELLISFMEKEQRGFATTRLVAVLLEMLELYPGLARTVEPNVVNRTYLFKLSTNKKSGDWLVRSGLDIENVLYWGIRTGAASVPLGGDNRSRSLKQWLGLNEKHQEAWDNLSAWDSALAQNHHDWIEKWIPAQVYKDSPLQLWVDQISNSPETWADKICPIEHPLFQENLIPLSGEKAVWAADKYAMYFRAIKPGRKETAEKLISINEAVRSEMNRNSRCLLPLGVNPTVLALSDSPTLLNEMMSGPSAQSIMAAFLEEKRTISLVRGWKSADVLRWLTSQEQWRSWRSGGGQTLLEFYLSTGPKLGRINKSLVSRLARQEPQWFIAGGAETGLIARLGLDDDTKSQVVRSALTAISNKNRGNRGAGRVGHGSKRPKM